MPAKHFTTDSWRPTDKVVCIYGPEGLNLAVDYDDVDHTAVRRVAKKMVRLLNKHWATEKEEVGV